MGKTRDYPVGLTCFLLTVLIIFISGCGGAVYRERVGETSRYFRRLEERDRFLSKDVWRAESISFRVPVGFVPNVDENNALRQPVSLNIPGLLGSWKSKLSTGKVADEKDGFLFLAGSRPPDGEDKEVIDLEQALIERISTAFAIGKNSIEKSKQRMSSPSEKGVVDQVEYVAYNFGIPESIAEFDGAYRGQLYFHRTRNRKIAILFLTPKDIAADEKNKVEHAISFSLETLSVVE